MNTKQEDADKEELLPCPFCGNDIVLFNGNGHDLFHQCADCGACGPSHLKDVVFRSWNTRTQPTPVTCGGRDNYLEKAWVKFVNDPKAVLASIPKTTIGIDSCAPTPVTHDGCKCMKCLSKEQKQVWHMVVCSICKNKRCPHSDDHTLECTNSNEPGQKGSRHEQ